MSTVELLDRDGDEVLVRANFVVYESRERGVTEWAGRSEYRLRATGGGWRMASKELVLVDDDRALHILASLV